VNGVLIGQHSASHDRREVERLLLSPKPSTLDAFLGAFSVSAALGMQPTQVTSPLP
jgi:hypothetical protein